jgi:GT2 family glycosyltransferase
MRPWVVVLTWNGRERLPLSLGSLVDLEGEFEVLVVDNGSSDGSAELARQLCPRAHLLRNDVNLGFAAGNNRGIRYALERGASHVAVINDDMKLDPGWLGALVDDGRRNPAAGIWGGMILFLDRPDVVNSAGISVDWMLRVRERGFGRPRVELGELKASSARAVTGGAMLVARCVFERIGGFDARLFAYYEDYDFCLRARRASFDVRFVPTALSYHVFAGTLGEHHPMRRYFLARNQMIMVGRYARAWKAIPLLAGTTLFRILLKAPLWLLRARADLARAELAAVTHGVPLACREMLGDAGGSRMALAADARSD